MHAQFGDPALVLIDARARHPHRFGTTHAPKILDQPTSPGRQPRGRHDSRLTPDGYSTSVKNSVGLERGFDARSPDQPCGTWSCVPRTVSSACLWILTLSPTLVLPAQVIESMTTGQPVVLVLLAPAVVLDVGLVGGGGQKPSPAANSRSLSVSLPFPRERFVGLVAEDIAEVGDRGVDLGNGRRG